MPWVQRCANCDREFPIYRITALVLDGELAGLCPRCVQTESARIAVPYSPQSPGPIQPSTGRTAW